MAEQVWKRTYFESWEDAFRGLAPVVRQQSVRVAAYTRVLFLQACEDGFCAGTSAGESQMQGRYADLAYKCGMYHQLGKALVPPEYQLWRDDFTEEERAVYRKYTTDGCDLIAALQESNAYDREKRGLSAPAPETANVPWRMQRESCLQHMERWNGSGFPEGRKGSAISPIAQIVGLAKELDHLAAETKSEEPFTEALDAIFAGEDADWNPALIRVLKNCRGKCRSVYNKYIHYSLTLPKTIPLVEKRKSRPMGLRYRPMADGRSGKVLLYEAEPWIGGIAGRDGATEPLSAAADLLRRTELTVDVSFYLLYEAADALLRMQNCRLAAQGILLPMLPEFYRAPSQLKRFAELFEDQPVDKSKLYLTVDALTFAMAGKGVRETIARYARNGVTLVLDGYEPSLCPADDVKAVGISHIRCKSKLYLQQDTAELMKRLRQEDFTLLGGEVDSEGAARWLSDCGVYAASGPAVGVAVEEDEMIRDCLLRERGN